MDFNESPTNAPEAGTVLQCDGYEIAAGRGFSSPVCYLPPLGVRQPLLQRFPNALVPLQLPLTPFLTLPTTWRKLHLPGAARH